MDLSVNIETEKEEKEEDFIVTYGPLYSTRTVNEVNADPQWG